MKSHHVLIGEGASADLSNLIASRLLVQANSGGGKSWLLRRLLEQSHGKVQQIVIDLEGEFVTLREKYDYIVAGKGGDVSANPRSAALLARKLVEFGPSAIIDLSELEKPERRRFVRLFLEAVMNTPKEFWHPILFVIDEAHDFCPEKGQAESASAIIDLATRGRKRGFCSVLATQRLSKLHKDAAAECNNKLIGRTGLDVDMKRAYEELGFTTREQYLSLRQLEAGQFFAFGPAISQQIVTVSVGDVLTKHPKAGQGFTAKAVKPTAKMREVIGKLGDIPKEAEQEAADIATLQQKVRTLEAEARSAAQHQCPKVADKATVETAVAAALEKERRENEREDKEIIARFEQLVVKSSSVVKSLEETITKITGKSVVKPDDRPMPYKPVELHGSRQTYQERVPAASAIAPPSFPGIGNGPDGAPLSVGEKAVLNAAAQHQVEGITKEHLTVLLGYKRSSRDAFIQRLRAKGYVTDGGGAVFATSEGMVILGSDFRPLPTGAELREKVLREIPQGEAKILELLVKAHPMTANRDELTELTGYKRSSRDAFLQRLAARQLVTFEGRGFVKASDKLF